MESWLLSSPLLVLCMNPLWSRYFKCDRITWTVKSDRPLHAALAAEYPLSDMITDKQISLTWQFVMFYIAHKRTLPKRRKLVAIGGAKRVVRVWQYKKWSLVSHILSQSWSRICFKYWGRKHSFAPPPSNQIYLGGGATPPPRLPTPIKLYFATAFSGWLTKITTCTSPSRTNEILQIYHLCVTIMFIEQPSCMYVCWLIWLHQCGSWRWWRWSQERSHGM